jgi:hypothetical protein
MAHKAIDTGVLSDPGWWHWAVTAGLLAAHLLHAPWALWSAWWLCAGMAAAYWYELRGVRPMPVQVRLAFLVLLAVGSLPGMHWLLVVLLVGTGTTVAVGCCSPARELVRRAALGRPERRLFRVADGLESVPEPVRVCSTRRPGCRSGG